MMLLCLGMEGRYYERTNEKCSYMCLRFNMQEKDKLELTNVKCHLCTLIINL